MASAKKKKAPVKKATAAKPAKKKTGTKPAGKKAPAKKTASKPKKSALKKPVSKSKKTGKVILTKKGIAAQVKSSKEIKRRYADVANDIDHEDLENLTPSEIEEELKSYEDTKPRPSAAKAAVSAADSPGLQLAKRISQFMFEKKAEDVVVADLEGLTSVTDYFVMCTATSDMHARAISDHVQDELEKSGTRVHHKEGYSSLRWVLLDYVDVIAHVFQKEAREFYDLERLWGDAQFIKMTDNVSR